jgi:TolB-like protein
MVLRTFLTELRRRGVLKAAAAYAVIGWVALQVLSLLFENFGAPGWVTKVVTTLVILGFPVACLMAWGFDITPEGVRPVPPAPKDAMPLPASHAAEPAARASESSAASIAVLPFVDMSAEHDQQYLGDGIAEELLNALASIDGLNVAARTSSFSLHGKNATMKEIGDVLHVRNVLEGSVRRSGQKLRVTAQLVDVESGFHLFSQSYDREMQDIFDIQNEIARHIVHALLPKLGLRQDAALVRQGTHDLEAYNLRLMAHQWLGKANPMTLDQPLGQLRQAIALDPEYADAWGDYAYLLAFSTSWAVDAVPLLMESYRAATVALDHAPDNVPALLVMGSAAMLVHRDPSAAGRYLGRARQAGVDFSLWATMNAIAYEGPLGRYDEALAALGEAEAKDPLAPNLRVPEVSLLLAQGRQAEAVAAADAALRLVPDAPALVVIAIRAHLAAGDVAKARELVDAGSNTSAVRYPGYASMRIATEVATGNRSAAQAMLDTLIEEGVEGRASACFAIGEACVALGEFDRAIEWWTRSVERRELWSLSFMPPLYRGHPVVGKDPRFHALLRRMGLE